MRIIAKIESNLVKMSETLIRVLNETDFEQDLKYTEDKDEIFNPDDEFHFRCDRDRE